MSQPTREACSAVDTRDMQCCVRCGLSLHVSHGSRHHRQSRRFGDHSAANLVLLCGSGTTGCHGWVHAHPALSREIGLIVPSWADPKSVPLYLGHLRRWAQHNESGDQIMLTPEQAAERMRAAGITS